ncbi:hypothetical protein KR054_002950, partial [Drosophila jambulina]
RVEFTNFVCTAMNKKFVDIDYCVLKAINRTYKYLSTKLTIYDKPITNAMVNFAVYKRANGYKPFLYNITVDACKFLKNQKSNPVVQYFFGFIKDITNANHSCPYYEDIIVEKLSLAIVNHQVTAVLPVPEGEYLVNIDWTGNKKATVNFKVYVKLS